MSEQWLLAIPGLFIVVCALDYWLNFAGRGHE